MRLGLWRGLCLAIVVGTLASGLIACSAAPKSAAHNVADAADYSGDDPGDPSLPDPRQPDNVGSDANALGAGERPHDASTPLPEGGVRPTTPNRDAGPTELDADTSLDSGPTMCSGPLAAGDLAIVEFMIATQSGSGDRGEWVEIQSTRDCTINLNGLHVESPRGSSSADAVDVTDDVMLGPNQTFIVADSAVSDVNYGLPGTVFSWVASDALKNDGDTITVSAGGVTIDSITYPKLTLHVGRSVSFPVDCAWSVRSDWMRWSWAFNVYATGVGDGGGSLQGTPNADNSDVACY